MNPSQQELAFTVNGERRCVVIRPAETLLDVLRTELGLTSAKPGCENGDCGACTVLVDSQPFKSCIMLAVECRDSSITTVEGLCDTPIQRAFVESYAFQCGYCTPGFIMNIHALLEQSDGVPDDNTIREWLESNICRCTSYEEIEHALKSAAVFRQP